MKLNNKGLSCLAGILFAAAMGACKKDNHGGPATPPQYDKNYYGRQAFVIALGSTYQNYDSALKKTGYIDTLAGEGPFTSFIMDDNLIYQWASSFPANIKFMVSSLIIKGDYPLRSLPMGPNQRFTTLSGNHLYISKYPLGTDSATYMINGTPLYAIDISSTNGHFNVLHTTIPNFEQYSSVLSYIQGSQTLTFFSLALKRTGLDKVLADTTKSWTVLAPADAAFKKSTDPGINNFDSLLTVDTAKLARIVRYHIIGGRNFYSDLTRGIVDQNKDTVRIAAILTDATPIKLYYSNAWPTYGYVFKSPGNTTPAVIYQPVYPMVLQDNIAVNGMVHQIDNVLLP